MMRRKLATVKKGTPLYGQPSWWGEDAGEGNKATDSSSKHNGDKKGATKNARPSNLGLTDGQTAAGASAVKGSSKSGSMEGERIKPHAGSTYMEIPLKDDDSPEGGEKSKETLTPAKSVSSSLSRDSLSASPDTKQGQKNAKTQSPGADVNAATSFTIDLDDQDHPKKSLNISSSISEFVPPKIRKNFRDRKDRLSKESTPNKNSEEREVSPLHQRKIDEIWSTVVEGKGKSSRLSSAQATAGTSLRSPNLEEIDRWSEISEERRSSERESEKKVAGKKSVPCKSPQVQKTTPSKAKATPSAAGATSKSPSAATAANLAQFPDSTSYLFNKMFEGGTTASGGSDKEVLPEQNLYTEAASHDKPLAARGSAEKPVVRPVIDDSIAIYGASVGVAKKQSKPVKVEKHRQEQEDDDDLRITEDIQDDSSELGTNDKEDKASETGTYTIEIDSKEGQEEEEARRRIDKVFGVDVEDFTSDHPSLDPHRMASPGGYDNVYDDDFGGDGEKTPLDENGRSPIDDDDLMVDDTYDDDETSDMAAPDDVQAWVSQLTALTSQKGNMAEDGSKENGDASLSKKPPQGLNRKRPGTGRKLPSIPTDRSPVSSEHSSYIGDQDLSIGDDLPSTRTSDFTVTGKNNASSNGRKAGQISSQAQSRTVSNGRKKDGASMASPQSSARSRGSLDTELLLEDTEKVMAAMEARVAYKSSRDKRHSYSVDSDTDVSSTVALVNGDEDFVKPTAYKSPREAMAKRQQKDVISKTKATVPPPPASTSKKPVAKSYSQKVASKSKAAASPRSTPSGNTATPKKSVVSDVYSRSDSMDNDSIMSDVSSDMGDGNLSRSSSKGKGNITMTKPNRAFELRRARADSIDEPTTPRSAKSRGSTKSVTSSSTARSSSVHSGTRNRSLGDTGRSEASLGAEIVKKSQNNSAQDRARRYSGAGIGRSDSGKQSQKLQRASSITLSQSALSSSHSKREPTPKSQLRSTPTGRGSLAITGIGSSISARSQSQPGSRSNSPKAAERMAWKRRKEYDPRKAVADAKAKAKDGSGNGVTMRPKPSASSSIKRRMIRSASFTNSKGLALGMHESVSGSQDFSDRRGQYEQEDLRRAFLPFQNSLRTDRSTHSADEDDSLVSATSAQTSYDSLIVSSIYQLTLKLKTSTDKTLSRLRDENRVSHTPSPIDDFLSDSGKSEITAWKSANQELAFILKNLRKLERHVQMMNTVLFPDDDINSDVSSGLPSGGQGKQKYFQEIERIRSELAGFHPIDHPRQEENEAASPEMDELMNQF